MYIFTQGNWSLVLKRHCAYIILLHQGLISEVRKKYKEQLCLPPSCFLCLVHCVLCLPFSIMQPRHVYNHGEIMVCLYATKAQRITARRRENTPQMSLERQLHSNIAHSLTRCTLTNLTRHPLYPPVSFACMEGPLLRMKDMSRHF